MVVLSMVVLSMVVIAFFPNPFSFYVGADADPCFTRPNRTMLSSNTSRSWTPSTGAIRKADGRAGVGILLPTQRERA